MVNNLPSISIIGGTGGLGTGLAKRWAQAGYSLFIGSRNLDRADKAVEELKAKIPASERKNVSLKALENLEAARAGDIVVLTVPYAHHTRTLTNIKNVVQGKVLIDVTVPLKPPKVARVQLPKEGSAGQIAQTILGESVRVVSAFQNAAAIHLQESSALDCDILVCGNNKDARQQVITLVEAAGLRGFHAGSINNSAAVEALTSLLIFINKQYGCHSGIRLTGLDD